MPVDEKMATTKGDTMTTRTTEPVALTMCQTETRTFGVTVTDDAGDPIDLSEMTLRFVVQDSNNPPTGIFKAEGEEIAVSGDDSNVASVTIAAAKSTTASTEYHWFLWDTATDAQLSSGTLWIKPALKDVT